MAFWNRKEKRASTTLAQPDEWLFDAFGGQKSKSGQRVTTRSALGLPPVWGAVSIISEQIGQLPLKVYKTIDGENVEATSSRGWNLLHDKPNEHTPAGRFWSTCANHLLLWGNVFLLKLRNDLGLVDEVYLLHPDRTVVKWDPKSRAKTFEYTETDGTQTSYDVGDVLHIFGLSLDGLIGETPVGVCKNAFGTALARDGFEGAFYRNGAVLSGSIKHPGRLSDKAVKHLRESAQILYGGADQAHQLAVFEEGSEFVVAGKPLRDLMFVESQQLSRTDIAVMFKLPPNMLGGSSGDGLTYSTVELNQQHLALNAISPWTNTIAQALSWDPGILPQSGFTCAFLLDGMLKADSKSRAEVYEKALDPAKGWMQRREVRERENLAPADDKPPEPVQPVIPDFPPPDPATAQINGQGG